MRFIQFVGIFETFSPVSRLLPAKLRYFVNLGIQTSLDSGILQLTSKEDKNQQVLQLQILFAVLSSFITFLDYTRLFFYSIYICFRSTLPLKNIHEDFPHMLVKWCDWKKIYDDLLSKALHNLYLFEKGVYQTMVDLQLLQDMFLKKILM